jgi:hypothetical protein
MAADELSLASYRVYVKAARPNLLEVMLASGALRRLSPMTLKRVRPTTVDATISGDGRS